MITVEQLKKFAPSVKGSDPYPSLVQALNDTMTKYLVNTPRRVRYFMAQSFFESRGYTHFAEDLYYTTPERLMVAFPTRMGMAKDNPAMGYAPDYLTNPQKLANFVYASRFGNGDIASGDGYKFRGRGGLGLTFKDNYLKYSMAVYGDDRCVKNPDLLLQFEDGVKSVGWFWDLHKLNALADTDSFTDCTKVIQGSARSVPERIPVLNKANSIF